MAAGLVEHPQIVGTVRGLAPNKVVRDLSQLKEWRGVLQVILEWAVIIGCIWVSESFWFPWLYVPAIIIIAGRMHGLAVMMHELAHYRVLENRKLAEILGDIFVAWPLLFTVDRYRQHHLKHHQYLNTEDDPDWKYKLHNPNFVLPKGKKAMALYLLSYLLGLRGFKEMLGFMRVNDSCTHSIFYVWGRRFFYLLIPIILYITNAWLEFLMYWFIPYITFFPMFMYIRTVSEHVGCEYKDELTYTRTVYGHVLGSLLFAPNGINYHIEHHLYPSVPFYNLAKLHEKLLHNETFKSGAHISPNGHMAVIFGECCSC